MTFRRKALVVLGAAAALLGAWSFVVNTEHYRVCMEHAQEHAEMVEKAEEYIAEGVKRLPAYDDGPIDSIDHILAFHRAARRLYESAAYQPWADVPEEPEYVVGGGAR